MGQPSMAGITGGVSKVDIQFYHLLTTPMEVALPKLVATAYQKGFRVCITAEESLIPMLDEILWTYHPGSFLPHGTYKDAQAEKHPILLAAEPILVNSPTLLLITNGIAPELQHAPYSRVFDMFDGNDEAALEKARARWKIYMEAGWPLTYIKQRADGGWDRQKEVNHPSATSG